MTQIPLLQNESVETSTSTRALLSAVIPPLEGEYLYSYDPTEHPTPLEGSILEVSLGRRTVNAFVLSTNSEKEIVAAKEMRERGISVKPIPKNSKPIHAFTTEHLPFLEWTAKYYAEPLSKILDVAIPTPAFGRLDPFIRLTSQDTSSCRGAAQLRVIDHLKQRSGWVPISAIREQCDANAGIIRALEQKGIIEKIDHLPASPTPSQGPTAPSLWDSLSTEQKDAAAPMLAHVTDHTFSSFLLHGVTGSGKTEVYLELIVEALKQNRSALVVVPEIALTPQLLERFESRLKQSVAVLHSSLRPPERWGYWARVLSGDIRVVIGARSAIFAPMKDLGVIIVDEEHDGSFKQGEGIRYNARDLALVRAKLSSCPIVLGSATPSLETFQHARTGKHHLLPLTQRFFTSQPLRFDIVDLNKIKPWEMPSKSISPKLLSSLKQTLSQKEQAFILYNRRGFATYLQCGCCENVVGCPHCSVTLTYHRNNNCLLCHFCGFSTPPPSACSQCGAKDPAAKGAHEGEPLFKLRGAGTERVYEELTTLLPEARIAKLDRDAVRSIEDYTAVLQKVRSKEVDILVGTQMIAKGHDLPDVTFVGIVDCDVGLHVPDFRAGERAFQLLTQVAGRAGRREKQGYVTLQTRVPNHPSLQMTTSANYHGFAEQELAMREMLGYPPFQKLLRVIIGAEDKSLAQRNAAILAEQAAQICPSLDIAMLGPAPAPVEKVRSYWRYHILFKAPSGAKLQSLMYRLKRDSDAAKSVRVIFDLDPQDML
jgi:primosomal protein N' (replication factor Y)